jgi:hypothetical protein
MKKPRSKWEVRYVGDRPETGKRFRPVHATLEAYDMREVLTILAKSSDVWVLQQVDLSNQVIPNVKYKGRSLTCTSFDGSDMYKSGMADVGTVSTTFKCANLRGVNMRSGVHRRCDDFYKARGQRRKGKGIWVPE